MIRLIVSLIAAVVTIPVDQAHAQGAFPAPLPNEQSAPADVSPFPRAYGPHASGAAPLASLGASAAFPSGSRNDACMNGFAPLREEVEERGRLIKAASDRKAPPDEACKLIGSFGQSEIRMIKYIEANSAKCGIPTQIADQFRNSHKNTEKMRKQVCTMAQQAQTGGTISVPGDVRRRAPAGPVGDFWPTSAPLLRAINPL